MVRAVHEPVNFCTFTGFHDRIILNCSILLDFDLQSSECTEILAQKYSHRNTRSAWILEWKQLYIKLLHAWCAHLVLGNRKEINRNKNSYCTLRSTHYCKRRSTFDVIYQIEIARQMHRFARQMAVSSLHFLACWPSLLATCSIPSY